MAIFDPQQLSVLRFKASLLSIAVVVAYWIDQAMFWNGPYIDASVPNDALHAARIHARALIYIGTIMGFTLAV